MLSRLDGNKRSQNASVAHRTGRQEVCLPAGLAEGAAEFAFQTGELRAAGQYTATAEWEEGREGLAAALAKRDASLRSTALTFTVRLRPFL